MNICYISDGKAGHQAQVMGLIQALSTKCPVQLTTVRVDKVKMANWRCAYQDLPFVPEVIIGAGHRTHVAVWLMGKRIRHSKTLIVMRPSLPLAWFDFIIMPAHDQKQASTIVDNRHVFITQGVMNRFVNEGRHQDKQVLILVGGTNKRFSFDSEQVLAQIKALCNYYTAEKMTITMTSSRRTPTALVDNLNQLVQQYSQVDFYPVEQTDADWLNNHYQQASHVWVTADSVNMIFEALTAGSQVGVIDLPKQRSDRITTMLTTLVDHHQLVTLPDFLNGASLPLPQPLNEAQRAADWLLQQLPDTK